MKYGFIPVSKYKAKDLKNATIGPTIGFVRYNGVNKQIEPKKEGK